MRRTKDPVTLIHSGIKMSWMQYNIFSHGVVNMLSKDISSEIETNLRKLVGTKFVRVKRMAVTGDIGFGNIRTITNRKESWRKNTGRHNAALLHPCACKSTSRITYKQHRS